MTPGLPPIADALPAADSSPPEPQPGPVLPAGIEFSVVHVLSTHDSTSAVGVQLPPACTPPILYLRVVGVAAFEVHEPAV